MNLPNRLTITRMILVIPFIIILSLTINKPFSYSNFNNAAILFITSGIIFLVAMITDYLDGYIARKRNIVSTFGKLFDPLADKFMTTSALILLAIANIVPFYFVIIFILRDILVDGSRNLAASKNKKIDASIWGKLKTMLMSISIVMIFFVWPIKEWNFEQKMLLNIPIIISALLSIFSGAQYFKNIIPLISHK